MKTHTEPAMPDLPVLSPEDAALFQRFVQNGFDLPALAAETGRLVTDLLRWFFTPPIQRYLDALQRAAEIAVELTAARARPTALRTLQNLAATAEDPLERRRAAASLATHSRPTPHPRRAPEPASERPAEAPSARQQTAPADALANEFSSLSSEPREAGPITPLTPNGLLHPVTAAPQAPVPLAA